MMGLRPIRFDTKWAVALSALPHVQRRGDRDLLIKAGKTRMVDIDDAHREPAYKIWR